MDIKILGGGCKNCKKLKEVVEQYLDENGKEYTIEEVTEMADIVSYGVIQTPALVVDGKVLFSGRVPSVRGMKKYFN